MQDSINNNLFRYQDTIIFRVNNLIKLLATILIMILIFNLDIIPGLIALVILTLFYKALGLKLRYVLILTFFILIFSLVFGIYSIFLFANEPRYIDIFEVKVNITPLLTSISLFYRTIRIILPIILYAFSSSLTQIEYGVNALFYPLYYIKFPVGLIVLTLSLTLGFIPIMIREVKRILLVQAVRGNDVEIQNFRQKIKTYTFMLIPLLISSLIKAEQLSYSIDSRNYDAFKKRDYYIIDKLNLKQKLIVSSLIILIIVLIFSIVISHFG